MRIEDLTYNFIFTKKEYNSIISSLLKLGYEWHSPGRMNINVFPVLLITSTRKGYEYEMDCRYDFKIFFKKEPILEKEYFKKIQKNRSKKLKRINKNGI